MGQLSSTEISKQLQSNPDAHREFHESYAADTCKWKVPGTEQNIRPVDQIVKSIDAYYKGKGYGDKATVVVDMGCGREFMLFRHLDSSCPTDMRLGDVKERPIQYKVYSVDFTIDFDQKYITQASRDKLSRETVRDRFLQCNMAEMTLSHHLKGNPADCVVFSLSLISADWFTIVKTAHAMMVEGGSLIIAQLESFFTADKMGDKESFEKKIMRVGFHMDRTVEFDYGGKWNIFIFSKKGSWAL
eukprot:Colp12_sorted_trinity150504_noHs@11564